jgi:hypothetical protein
LGGRQCVEQAGEFFLAQRLFKSIRRAQISQKLLFPLQFVMELKRANFRRLLRDILLTDFAPLIHLAPE